MLLTSFVLTLATPFLITIVMFFVPGGRKGNMRTEREVVHSGITVEQAKALYSDRLAFDGFVITDEMDPRRLKATKPKAPRTRTHTHNDNGLSVEIDITPDPRGARVRIAIWMNDFVFYDSGEGRLIDLTLDRLISAELGQQPAPIVPNLSFVALSSLTVVLLSIAVIAWLTFGVRLRSIWLAAVVAGAALACLTSILVALKALVEIRRRPAELTGKGLVAAAMIAGLLGTLAGAITLSVCFGDIVVKAARQWAQ
jgi:hypothetical protein